MATVTLELPSLLADLIDSPRTLSVTADTVEEAIESLLVRHPALRVHFFDELGELRRFVLCFVNGENAAWRGGLAAPVRDGDVVTVLQSVSGG